MTTATITSSPALRQTWLGRTESWLDQRGKGAWIALTILAFVLFWPIGLAILGYAALSGRIFTGGRSGGCAMRRAASAGRAYRSSGNSAFDAYKADTLRRLEEEQEAFEKFLERLRAAKDKSEFDQFMADRDRKRNESDEQ